MMTGFIRMISKSPKFTGLQPIRRMSDVRDMLMIRVASALSGTAGLAGFSGDSTTPLSQGIASHPSHGSSLKATLTTSEPRLSILGQSRGSESALWGKVSANLGKIGHFERIENAVGSGTPDVAYTFWRGAFQRTGWIELKVIDHLPTKDDCVFVPHFRKAQRVWHIRHSMYNGKSFVLLYIKRTKDYWLFTGIEACKWMGNPIDLDEIVKMELVMRERGSFPTQQLLEVL